MSIADWAVLISSLVLISVYGIWKSRGSKNIEGYLRGDNSMPWYAVGLSVMATQASAITFLSAPGLAYTDGMRFVQFYFGLPIAMIILCITVVPIFYRLKVFTAYEYLETRFDLKTRSLAALLFLTQRGLAAGLTIYAPSIILSTLLGWDIYWTNIFMGGIVVIYTVAGGSKAVNYTQLAQMAVILGGMLIAGYMIVQKLPAGMSFTDAAAMSGQMGKLNAIDLSFDLNNRYNIWSGLIGGLFLAMAYFGTDQSQVSRYLNGQSVTQSRLGLLMNGVVKIPMQFGILFIGTMMYVFYLVNPAPAFFNQQELDKLSHSRYSADAAMLLSLHEQSNTGKQLHAQELLTAIQQDDKNKIASSQNAIHAVEKEQRIIRDSLTSLMKQNNPRAETNDVNYIFLNFVTHHLPVGLIGLLIAVIFAASMSSTSSELNALASATVIDIYRRIVRKEAPAKVYLNASKIFTLFWGIYAITVAEFANRMGSLIEAVNVLGSLFYGTILGIFLVAFYLKQVKGGVVFYAALISEVVVIAFYNFSGISFLWYNVIGCLLVMSLSLILGRFAPTAKIKAGH